MGGAGSGRIQTRERELIENCDSLDVAFISRLDYTFFPVYASIETDSDRAFLLIDYNTSIIGPRFNLIDRFEITKTRPHFGGERNWIICNRCRRRVRKLYRPESKSFFKCRVCHDLMYQSQESNVYDGWLRKAAIGNGMSPRRYEKVLLD